jgi:hypothetical protein
MDAGIAETMGAIMAIRRLPTAGKVLALLSVLAVLCAGARAAAGTTRQGAGNGETYIGSIWNYSKILGTIQIEHQDPAIAKKRLSFAVDGETVVRAGKDEVDLSDVWRRTRKVRVAVSQGKVGRIDILEWK